jgi:tripartite-type tricarboxylate transporter receptor subunit TctC
MDPALVSKIQTDIAAALKDPAVAEYLKKTGSFAIGSTPAEFDAYMHAEADKWGPVLKAANIKMQ